MTRVRLTKEEQYKLNLSERLVLFYRKYPVIACKELLMIDLVWFQRIALRSLWAHKYVMLLFGRGIGKTYLGAIFTVLYGLLYPGVAIGIITPSFKQTEFFFDKIEEMYEASPYLRASVYRKPVRATYKALLKFRNGSYIEGLPLGSGQKVRGRRYNIIWCDEYAYIDEDIIKTVIRPMMNVVKKGMINRYIISSTASYTWNHLYPQYLLYNYMKEKQPHLYDIHEYTFEDVNAIENSPFLMDKEVYEMMRMDTTDELYLMENKCVFPTENVGFFSAQLLDKCTPKVTELEESSPIELLGDMNVKYSMGIDAARVAGGDNFSISVIKLDGGVKRFVYNETHNGITYQKMIESIRKVMLRFNIVQINLDASGGGTTIKDLLVEAYRLQDGRILPPILDMDDKETETLSGMRILRLVKFSAPVVNDLYMRLKADFQHKLLLLPIDLRRHSNKELEKAGNEIIQTKRELLVLQAIGKGVYYSFEAPAQFKKDRATSLVLANQAANEVMSGVKPEETVALAQGFWV